MFSGQYTIRESQMLHVNIPPSLPFACIPSLSPAVLILSLPTYHPFLPYCPYHHSKMAQVDNTLTTHPSFTDVGEDDCFAGPPPSAPGYGWVGDLRLDLPVDEDDYLMPSPQPSGLATVGPSHQHYMDLMADAPGKSRHMACFVS